MQTIWQVCKFASLVGEPVCKIIGNIGSSSRYCLFLSHDRIIPYSAHRRKPPNANYLAGMQICLFGWGTRVQDNWEYWEFFTLLWEGSGGFVGRSATEKPIPLSNGAAGRGEHSACARNPAKVRERCEASPRSKATNSAVFPAHGEIPSLIISEAPRRAQSAAEQFGGEAAIIARNLFTEVTPSRWVILRHEVPKNLPFAFEILGRSLRMTDGALFAHLPRKPCTRVFAK